MLSLFCAGFAFAPFGQVGALDNWPNIARHHPIAYAIYGQEIAFYDRNGEAIGRTWMPDMCSGVGMSPDGRFADFRCVGPKEAFAPYLLVTDSTGKTARVEALSHGFQAAWTKDDILAIFTGGFQEGPVPERVDGFNIPIIHVKKPVDQFSLATSGSHGGIGFHNIFMGSVITVPFPPKQGAFWLDRKLNPDGKMFEGQEVEAVSVSADGQFVAAVINRTPAPSLQVMRAADHHVVFELDVAEHKYFELSNLAWSPTGHTISVTAREAGSSAWTNLLLDADTLKFSERKCPCIKVSCVRWTDPNTLFVAGEGRIDLLNTKSGTWTKKAFLPYSSPLRPIE